MLGQPALAYEKNQWKTEFLFLVPFVLNPFILIKLGINIVFLEIFLQAMVDLHWGVSLSFNSHTCIHRGHRPGNMSELSFSLPHEQ